jgi:hypothetical protein
MNRVEARLVAEGDTSGNDEGNKLFRKNQRRMDLIPVVMRGIDLLGDPFETPSFTVNISSTGVCLLLPDGLVAVGQPVDLESPEFSLRGTVRWVVAGKIGNTMLTGIEFDTVKAQEAPTDQSSAETSVAAESNSAREVPVTTNS